MQFLRCIHDTTLLPSTTTTRSSARSLPKAFASHLTASQRTLFTRGNGVCGSQQESGVR